MFSEKPLLIIIPVIYFDQRKNVCKFLLQLWYFALFYVFVLCSNDAVADICFCAEQ